MGLHDLTGKEHPIEHAYEVSGRGCMISRVRNIRSKMLTRYQVGAAGSHVVGNYRSYDVSAGSHGFGTTDPTCLQGIRTRLKDLTGSEHHIVHAYRVSGQGCRISRVRNIRSYMPTRYQDGAAGTFDFAITYVTDCYMCYISELNGYLW